MSNKDSNTYYAVIFTSVISEYTEGYKKMAIEMIEVARGIKGFMGIDSAREKLGISIYYWENIQAIKEWKNHSKHLIAQKLGKEKWYNFYKVRVVKVLRDYEFSKL